MEAALLQKPNSLAYLCLAYLYVVWGTSYLANHYLLETLPPLLMAGTRFCLAGGVLLLLTARQPRPLPRARLSAILTGWLLLGLGSGGVVYAQQTVDTGVAAISVASVGLWTTIFSALLGQPIRRLDWLAVFLGLSGVALVQADQGLKASPLGALALLLGAASWGLGTALTRRLPLPRGLLLAGYQMLSGGAFLLLVAGLRGETIHSRPSLLSVLAFFYLLIAASLLAYSAFLYLVEHVKPGLATSYAYVNPVLAVALGHFLNGEVLSAHAGLGLGLILLALYAITRN